MSTAVHPLAFPRLAARMAEVDIQTKQLAAIVECHPGTLTQIRRGQVKPGAALKQRIADALDSTVEELFAEVEK